MQIPFTQTKEYLGWQESVGNKTFYKEFFDIKENIAAICASVVLELKIGKVLYCPFGPVFFEQITNEQKKEVFKYLRDLGSNENCIFVRFENDTQVAPVLYTGATCVSPPIKTYSKEGIFQPRVEWCLDLTSPPTPLLRGEQAQVLENIYNSFSKNCKYSIRRSEKENMEVSVVTENFENYLSDFLKIMHETGERNGFINHEDKYFVKVFESLNIPPDPPSKWGESTQGQVGLRGFLVLSKIDEVVVNMAVIILNKKIGESGGLTANYVFGGSREYKREFGATFRTQWEAIKQAKQMGATVYNFGGINNGVFGKSSLQGVTNFKKQFGGYEKFNGYFYDISIQKFKYFLYIIYKLIK